ncbi:MAG TPA: DUF881 domain-containing protein [Egibacteraceae bacterium]|nr:DUF881 domain-containing protein [Egibacteraceae bacterium]
MSATSAPALRGPLMRVGVALACGLLGFLLVAQVRATESVEDRLAGEREEDLAQILSDLSAEADRLTLEITDLRLTLLAVQNEAEGEQVALRSLQRRLDDLRILAGVVAAEGEGISFVIEDPAGQVRQDLLVDTIQELRDAGGEAMAVNGVRLIVSSAFSVRRDRLLLDGQPLTPPYRIVAVGPADTMAKALAIPGGAIDTLEARTEVRTTVEQLAQLTVPARPQTAPFVFGEPVVESRDGE